MFIFLSKSGRCCTYPSFVIPHLDYCSVVWHNCGVVQTTRAECIQNYALRVFLKKTSRSDTKEMCSQLSLPTLEHRRLTSTLLQVHRCLHSQPAPEYLSHKFVSKSRFSLCQLSSNQRGYKSTFEVSPYKCLQIYF